MAGNFSQGGNIVVEASRSLSLVGIEVTHVLSGSIPCPFLELSSCGRGKIAPSGGIDCTVDVCVVYEVADLAHETSYSGDCIPEVVELTDNLSDLKADGFRDLCTIAAQVCSSTSCANS